VTRLSRFQKRPASAPGTRRTTEASHASGERTRQFDRQFSLIKLPVFHARLLWAGLRRQTPGCSRAARPGRASRPVRRCGVLVAGDASARARSARISMVRPWLSATASSRPSRPRAGRGWSWARWPGRVTNAGPVLRFITPYRHDGGLLRCQTGPSKRAKPTPFAKQLVTGLFDEVVSAHIAVTRLNS
jgi:hypothetical protein